ncbi:MAG: AbgT family transporter [Alphaproteobacteria bacterium]|nr:AbgT family transporter [Alphaproteobacteria bacterium]
MSDTTIKSEKPSRLIRILNGIESVGNKLPDPVTLFILSILVVMVLSAILAGQGTTAINPATGEKVTAISLLDSAQIRRLLVELPQILTAFPPLGIVLVVIIGSGLAERAGFFAAAMKGLVRAVPRPLMTLTIVFAGVQANIASDAGYVVLIPLAAVVFASSGRHPVAGLSAAFAGVAGGFAANFAITPGDGILSGMTQAAAQLIDKSYTVEITANWYFLAALVPVYVIVGTLVCERIVEPRLNAGPKWIPVAPPPIDLDQDRREARGLRLAGIGFLLVIATVGFLAWSPGAPLRGDDGSFEPLFRSMVAIMFAVFLVCGIGYGVGAGTIKSDKDAVSLAAKGVGDLSPYLVLVFFAAVFVALFGWSNIGGLLAIGGAESLKGAGLDGAPVVLLFSVILLAMMCDLLIGSASAKWAILSPILVPMFMLLGIAPEATQAAYRVGDSTTNMITPFMSYFPLILVMARKYLPDYGIGSMIALMLPYTVSFFLASGAFFVGWYLLGLPFGPGVESVYKPGA